MAWRRKSDFCERWGLSGRRSPARSNVACLAAVCLVLMIAPASQVSADSTDHIEHSRVFRIAPQPLASALETYSRAAKIQILYDTASAADCVSPGVEGFLSPHEALDRLLRGTGLFASYETSKSVVLLSVSGASQAELSAPVLTLDALKVDAQPAGSPSVFYTMYARLVQEDIRRQLAVSPITRALNYTMRMKVWVSNRGAIERSALFNSSGDRDTDAAVLDAVQKIAIDRGPPSGMPQPIHVRITSQDPS